jgi:hypothetical protein
MPHVLEWYGSYCSSLAEKCEKLSTSKLLRLLAIDLIIEADKHRRRLALGKLRSEKRPGMQARGL